MNEVTVHISVLDYLRSVIPEALVYHCPNGGWRGIREATKFKRMGTLAGVPDLTVLAPNGTTFFIEIKTDKGRLSAEQRAFATKAKTLGYPVFTVRSIDDARDALEEMGIETRESV